MSEVKAPTAKELKQLEKEVQDAHKKLEDARILRAKLVDEPQNRKKIGQCFVYENSGCGENKWPLYTKILGVEGDRFNILEFEKRPEEDWNITLKSSWDDFSDMTKISGEEFDRAYVMMLDELTALIENTPE
jgi:hypothetical protein